MKTALILGSILALGFTITACGSDSASCKSLCEEGNKCEGATQTDCAAQCTTYDNVAKASDCKSKYDAVIDCSDGLSKEQACDDTNTTCDSQLSAFQACVTTYCTANPTNSACTAL